MITQTELTFSRRPKTSITVPPLAGVDRLSATFDRGDEGVSGEEAVPHHGLFAGSDHHVARDAARAEGTVLLPTLGVVAGQVGAKRRDVIALENRHHRLVSIGGRFDRLAVGAPVGGEVEQDDLAFRLCGCESRMRIGLPEIIFRSEGADGDETGPRREQTDDRDDQPPAHLGGDLPGAEDHPEHGGGDDGEDQPQTDRPGVERPAMAASSRGRPGAARISGGACRGALFAVTAEDGFIDRRRLATIRSGQHRQHDVEGLRLGTDAGRVVAGLEAHLEFEAELADRGVRRHLDRQVGDGLALVDRHGGVGEGNLHQVRRRPLDVAKGDPGRGCLRHRDRRRNRGEIEFVAAATGCGLGMPAVGVVDDDRQEHLLTRDRRSDGQLRGDRDRVVDPQIAHLGLCGGARTESGPGGSAGSRAR